MEKLLEMLIRCVSEQGYEISASADGVVLRSDPEDPWAWTRDRVAMCDGIYTRMEVGMSVFVLRKRIGCPDRLTAQVLLLAWTCTGKDIPSELRNALREWIPRLLEKTTDVWNGQFILNSLRCYCE